jgi:hypothetical protein
MAAMTGIRALDELAGLVLLTLVVILSGIGLLISSGRPQQEGPRR